ncbi:MAG: sugar O-acetyltransferase [Cyclobacteriaceae bacterium]|nr:sugar O-acetyltransferase [Cyclobacteriaceae bacterium]
MTEKEKMLQGEYYNSRDEELIKMYHRARKLMQSYNNLDSENSGKRIEILKNLLGNIEEGVWIEAPFFCDYGENISIGANTFINCNCIFLDDNIIKMGKNGLIGPHVQIYTASHPLNAHERIVANGEGNNTYRTFSKPVIIGDNVWIGGNTSIMPGVRIGNNVTIGAGSVVTKDIPDDVLAFGNPCRVKRKISYSQQINK